jgi:hypothetical protein
MDDEALADEGAAGFTTVSIGGSQIDIGSLGLEAMRKDALKNTRLEDGSRDRQRDDWLMKASRGGLAEENGGTKEIQIKVLGYQNSRTGDESAARAREYFRQAVQEAKSRLADKKDDDEALLKKILQGEILTDVSAGGIHRDDTQMVRVPSVPEQILSNLSQNLQAGRDEFVIKLMPEGLGEITIKLRTAQDKTILRIIATNSQTARMINDDLAALQNALKLSRVEVREAISAPETGNEANAYFSGFDSFNQFSRFGNQGQMSDFREDKRLSRVSEPSREETACDHAPAMMSAVSDKELNVYV